MKTEYHILSLGAGVQSTAMALMSHSRAIPNIIPVFDAAIFADTGGEPEGVYTHLEWLRREVEPSFPIIVRKKGDLHKDLLVGQNSTGGRFASIPAFTAAEEGELAGMVRRQCTKEYKTEVVERAIRRDILGLEPRKRIPKGVKIHQWIGLSYDEPQRIFGRGSRPGVKSRIEAKGYIPHFPLHDQMLTREMLRDWLERYGIPHRVPRSACTFCPYHSDQEWLRMKEEDPKSFAQAVEVDEALRKEGNVCNRNMDQKLYLHRACRPLKDVEFKPKEEHEKQMDLNFAAFECEGLCGH
jgi:hypothetical protein